jgi:hypothetical protein
MLAPMLSHSALRQLATARRTLITTQLLLRQTTRHPRIHLTPFTAGTRLFLPSYGPKPNQTSAAKQQHISSPSASPTQDEQLLRTAISRLTPAQITYLLTNPNPFTQWPAQPPFSPAPRRPLSRRRRIFLGIVIAFAAYLTTQYYLRANPVSQPLVAPLLEIPPPATEEEALERYAQNLDAYTAACAEMPLVRQMLESEDWIVIPAYLHPAWRKDAISRLEAGDIGPDDFPPAVSFNLGALTSFSATLPEEEYRSHLVAGACAEAVPLFLVFHNRLTEEVVAVVYFGPEAAGWPSVVHGGLLTSVLLEAMDVLNRIYAGTSATSSTTSTVHPVAGTPVAGTPIAGATTTTTTKDPIVHPAPRTGILDIKFHRPVWTMAPYIIRVNDVQMGQEPAEQEEQKKHLFRDRLISGRFNRSESSDDMFSAYYVTTARLESLNAEDHPAGTELLTEATAVFFTPTVQTDKDKGKGDEHQRQ